VIPAAGRAAPLVYSGASQPRAGRSEQGEQAGTCGHAAALQRCSLRAPHGFSVFRVWLTGEGGIKNGAGSETAQASKWSSAADPPCPLVDAPEVLKQR